MTHTHEHAPPSNFRTPEMPHMGVLGDMETQNELQVRLALLAYKLQHPDVESAINASHPEANDTEVNNAAMESWVRDHSASFRSWLSEQDPHERANLDDAEYMRGILERIIIEDFSSTPLTIH